MIETTEGYTYNRNAKEIFEKFFGTKNPFSSFGFDTTPFSSKLTKAEPKKGKPVILNLECTLKELYLGCTKKIQVTRKRFNKDGVLEDNDKMLSINVKPGWKNGVKISFVGEGDEALNTIAPDLVFVIKEQTKEANGYTREGNDLIYTHKISLTDALTDCSLKIPTLDDRLISLACPEVVSPFYEKRIAGEGMPLSKPVGEKVKGDLLIRFHILFPKYLNQAKREKVKELFGGEELQN